MRASVHLSGSFLSHLFLHISIQDDFFTGIAAYYYAMVVGCRYVQTQTYFITVCAYRVPMQQFSNGTLCSIVACLERFILSGSNNVT